jgi:hypothetical protein
MIPMVKRFWFWGIGRIKSVLNFPFEVATTFILGALVLAIGVLAASHLAIHPLLTVGILFALGVVGSLCCKISFRAGGEGERMTRLQAEIDDRRRREDALLLEATQVEHERREKEEALNRQIAEQRNLARQRALEVEELKKRGMNIIESANVFLVSLLRLKLSEVIPVDRLWDGSRFERFDSEWDETGKMITDKSYRRIAAIRITKNLFVGFDLAEVKVAVKDKTAMYVLPQPKITFDLENQEEEWPIDMILRPERTIGGKLKKIAGHIPFIGPDASLVDHNECTWKMVRPDDHKPAEIVKLDRDVLKDAKDAYIGSPAIKNATDEVRCRIRDIVEKQIMFKGYFSQEVDKLPVGCQAMPLMQLLRDDNLMLLPQSPEMSNRAAT